MKHVLMVAFHFPPAAMGSGHLRTLGFARHLPSLGWEPEVLTATPAAYPHVQASNLDLIPGSCTVHRAMALDAGRHLAIHGKYPGFIAQPDRWSSWWIAAVIEGMALVRRSHIDAIWSTYPIMTAHCIAYTLSRWARLPWVADFRDPVGTSAYAGNPYLVASQVRWERRVLSRAQRIVFTTPGAMRSYAERFPTASRRDGLRMIPNGYEESAFAGISSSRRPFAGRPITLVHSGVLYRDGRDPVPFLRALAAIKRIGDGTLQGVRVLLRGSGNDQAFGAKIRQFGLEDVVQLAPAVSNQEALSEQADADGLLLFQGRKFDHQVPAKAYEYLRVGRPIFALVSATGDTARLMHEAHAAVVVSMEDSDAIRTALLSFIPLLRSDRAPITPRSQVERYSRSRGAAILAEVLNEVDRERQAARVQ